MAQGKTGGNTIRVTLGFEAKFWSMADSLHGNVNPMDGRCFLRSGVLQLSHPEEQLSMVQGKLVQGDGDS